MPIEFPLPNRGAPWAWPENRTSAAALSVANGARRYVPNLDSADLTTPIHDSPFGGAVYRAAPKAANLPRLGTYYQSAETASRAMSPPIVIQRFVAPPEQSGYLVWRLAGVSRDSTGAALGACTVKVFSTATDEKVAQTVSDASGNWTVDMLRQGPFYFVEYLVGSPDRAGTSINTNVPAFVSGS